LAKIGEIATKFPTFAPTLRQFIPPSCMPLPTIRSSINAIESE